MRAIVDRKDLDRRAASTSQMGRFETERLATEENPAALINLSGIWIDRVHDRKTPKMIVLDMDSYQGALIMTHRDAFPRLSARGAWRGDAPASRALTMVDTGSV